MGRTRLFPVIVLVAACGGGSTSPPADGRPPSDGAVDATVDATVDAGLPDAEATDGPPDASATADAATDGPATDGPATDGATDAAVDAPTALELAAPEAPGRHCRYGGQRIVRGVDDGAGGATAGDGALAPSEIDSVGYTCGPPPAAGMLWPTGLDSVPASTCQVPSGTGLRGVTTAPAFTQVVFPPDPDCHAGINDVSCTDAFRPMALRQSPTTRRFYVAQQNGRVLTFPEGGTAATVALDLSTKVIWGYEPGLTQFAIDPRAPDRVYVTYITCPASTIGVGGPSCVDGEQADVRTVVAGFRVLADGTIDPASEWLVFDIAHARTEHNGGGAQFGPDGLLYVGVGDGGLFPAVAPRRLDSLLGKILRVDVHAADGSPLPTATPYRIPADNPHVATPGARGEIFARGVRNPWRFDVSLDEGRPAVWLGDVGLVTSEEINLAHAGDDLGWPDVEGPYCRSNPDQVTVTTGTACLAGTTPPVAWYRQAEGVSVTGGMVYRGQALSGLRGTYLYADFTTGNISSLTWQGSGWTRNLVVRTSGAIGSFATDLSGELYTLDWWSGAIAKLVPTAATPAQPAPLLSQTGCVDAADPHVPGPGAIRYAVNAPLLDGDDVYKERWMYLTNGAQLLEWSDTGVYNATPGTIAVKNFDVGERRVETRIMYLHSDWTWSFWTYQWRADGSDAVRVDSGRTDSVDGQPWRIPERGECQLCHDDGRLLGMRVEQLNGPMYYPSTGRWANQLDTLRALGKAARLTVPGFSVVPVPPTATLPRWPEYDDTAAPVGERVGAFLTSNCAHCHRPAGAGRGNFTMFDRTSLCQQALAADIFDDPTMRVVVPGDPARSMVWRRLVEDTLPYRMAAGRQRREHTGSALVAAWITTTAATECAP
ncbi:MAG: PQQ-dependent sugar dehydrogenase [Kofleriaceae bacterium]